MGPGGTADRPAGSAGAGTANVLSEHEIEALDAIAAQSQAELLLERLINHYRGANEQIAQRVDSWNGQLKLDGRLHELFTRDQL